MRASFGKTCWRTGLAFVFVSTGIGATRVAAQEPANEAELRSEMATAERLLG